MINVYQCVSLISQGAIVYLGNAKKICDEHAHLAEILWKEFTAKPDKYSVVDFDTEEKAVGEWYEIPSSVVESVHASIAVGEVQPSALRTDYHTVPLKQTLSKVRSMQEYLQETIQQMSPADQLAVRYVHSVHVLNVGLMVFAKLAALVLGIKQHQLPGYEHLLSRNFFSSFVNALATTLDSRGILFPNQPHVMKALQVLAKVGCENRKLPYNLIVPTTAPEAEASENVDEKGEHSIESSEQKILNGDMKSEQTTAPFYSVAASYSIDKPSDYGIYRRLVEGTRNRYKINIGSGVGSAVNRKHMFLDMSTEVVIGTVLICDKIILDCFCNMKCGADLNSGLRVKEKSVLCKLKLQKNSTEKVPYLPSPIDKPFRLVERKMCLEEVYCRPSFRAEVGFCRMRWEEVGENGTISELESVMNNFPGDLSPEDSCKYGISRPSPPTPPSWCWQRRLQGLSLVNIRYFLCNGSTSKVQELDTKCNETVCHAAVHMFPDERVLPFLRILESRKVDVFIHCDKDGNVPLHIAVSTGNIEAVKVLTEISCKAIQITNCEGATPIDLAFNSNQNGIFVYLLDQMLTAYPKCPDNIELLQSLLLRAMKKGRTEYLRILLKLQSQYEIAINFNCTDSDGHTAWVYVKKLSSLVHEEVKDVLDDSNIEPELKASIKAQFMTKVSGQDECTATSEDVLVATAATCKDENSAVTSGGHTSMVDGLDLATAYLYKKLKQGSKDKLLRDKESVSQSLPLVPPSVLRTLNVYTTDDYSEDDDFYLQKMNHRRKKKERNKPRSLRRTVSASFQFRPVGSGRSSSDQSTEPLLKPTLSMQKKLKKNVQRMRSMQRIEKYRRPTSEVESKKKKRRFKTGDSKARAKQKGAGSLARYEEMETDTVTPDDEECLSESPHQGVHESNAICSIPCTLDTKSQQDSQLVVSTGMKLVDGKTRIKENGLGNEDSEPEHSSRVDDETVTATESSEWKGTIATFQKVRHYQNVTCRASSDLLHFRQLLKLEHIECLGHMMHQACSIYPSFVTKVCLPSQTKMIKGTSCSAVSPNTDMCTPKQFLSQMQDLVVDESKPEFPYRGLFNNTDLMVTVHCITEYEMLHDLQHMPAGISLLDCRVKVPQIQRMNKEELQVHLQQLYQQQIFISTTNFLQFPSLLKLKQVNCLNFVLSDNSSYTTFPIICSLPHDLLGLKFRRLILHAQLLLKNGLSRPLKYMPTQLQTMICYDEVADDKDVWLQCSPVHRKAVSKIKNEVNAASSQSEDALAVHNSQYCDSCSNFKFYINGIHFGHVMLYDFAGQHEYNSSHAPVMENLILPSPPLNWERCIQHLNQLLTKISVAQHLHLKLEMTGHLDRALIHTPSVHAHLSSDRAHMIKAFKLLLTMSLQEAISIDGPNQLTKYDEEIYMSSNFRQLRFLICDLQLQYPLDLQVVNDQSSPVVKLQPKEDCLIVKSMSQQCIRQSETVTLKTALDWRKTVFGIHNAKSHNSRYFLLVSCLDHLLPLYTPRVNQNVVSPKKTEQVKSDESSPTTAAKPKAPNTDTYKQVTKCSDPTFRSWVEEFIREHGFENLKRVIPRNIHFLLGLTQWKGQYMSNQFKKVLSEILDMARHNRSAFPNYAICNLNSLSAMPRSAVRTPVRSTHERGGNKTGVSKIPGNKTLKLKLKQQSSTDPGRLALANTNQPLEVIRSHLSTYSKCCPRHDIQNIVVICNTCPASAAFGPKRRYSAIKDLRDDTRHAPFNASTSFKGDYSTSGSMNHLSQQNHRVMSDKPMLAAVTRDKRAEPQTATEITHSHHQLVTRVSLPAPLQPPMDVPNQKHQGQSSSGIHSMRNPLPGSHISTLSPYTESAERQRQFPSQLSKARHAPLSPVPQAPEHSLTTMMPSNSTRKASEFNTAGRTQLNPEDNLHRSAELLLRHTEHSSQHGENAGALAEHSGQYSRYTMEQRESQPSRNVTREIQHTAQHSLSTVEQREHKDRIRISAELLHAQDYHRIFPIAYEGKPPHTYPPELQIPYIFITGLAYYKMSIHKKSVQYFQQCLQLAEECGRDGDVTICCIYNGDIEFAQRKYGEAAERYQKALRYYSRDSVAKDFRMILPTQSALWSKCGSAFKNASKMADSITAYEEAIEQATSKKDKLAAHTSLGNLYQGIGENGRAVKEYEDAIQLAAELDDKVSLGWNHGNLGNALLGLYQRDKALHHLFKALDMAVEHETTPQAIGRAYNNLGTAYQAINDYSEAEKHYDLALSQAIYGNDIPGQARVYGNIGNLQMLKKEFDRAVPHYTEVMRLSQDKSTVTTAHHNRGCAYYDWAEKKKMALSERSSQKGSSPFKVSLHGPQFEHSEDDRPMIIPSSIQKYYLQGTRDLEYVIKRHEESFHGIKGSSKGLSLSVSLFETNSRTFHRMQDCLIHLKKSEDEPSRFEDALLVAEQSRARTLGELLLSRRGPQLKHQLMSPPSLAQLKSIVARQSCPVVYLSYTGERLLGWVLVPTTAGECSLNMFEVPLSDSEFDGKSFDYHLRYSLNELLVEKTFEMYKPFENEKEQTDPVKKLYNLVAKPLMAMLQNLERESQSQDEPQDEGKKIIIIPDSYTNLLPFTALLDEDMNFWGDRYYFQIMPSLLTMGILDQLPTVSVTIPVEHQQMMCVVGNPTIPPFKYNDDEWNLGKLPHATKEAEWVAHILKCTPILHEQATKTAVMMRLMNAKVIHLATHGSAVAGFLAFAGMAASLNQSVDAKQVLIYPEEIEKFSITPALVVLSSCDSGRGVFKADGIQGMARAFILAGAQAVLTTLWRVPDESACIFMQFFYQYLVDGVRGTEALHKAMLSVRCFSKYSQYIHWSGYQLTGREFQFSINESSSAAELTTRLGCNSVFPQLDVLKKLKNAFLNDPRLPTDIQVLISCILYFSIVNLLLLC